MYHDLPTRIKESLLTMVMNDAPSVQRNKAITLNKQRKHKQNKQDMLKRTKLLVAQKLYLYVNVLAYIEMYHFSAGWQTKPTALVEFSKLTSKSA